MSKSKFLKMPDKRLTLNTVYCADNLAVMKTLPNECIDLIYIDPPFNTRSVRKAKEWDAKVQGLEYYDSYGNGIMSYVAFMRDRLQQMYRLLKPTGSIFIHVDYRSVHYLKVELDKIFGQTSMDKGTKHLVNEIIWYYSQGGGKITDHFKKRHDNILWYAKDISKYYFCDDDIRLPYTPHKKHSNGTNYGGTMGRDKNGREYVEKWGTGKKKKYRYYLDQGKMPEDVWTDIQSIQSAAKERLGYPTQKPLILLERIIKSTTKEGDIVADFFCGCGTALSAAQKLGRHWVGVDASQQAVKVIRKRMTKEHNLEINESTLEKATLEKIFLLDHKEFEIAMVQYLGGIPNPQGGGDGGLDGVMADTGEPIQVKQFIPNRAEFDKFYKHLKKHKQGSYIAYDFTTGVKEEVMRLKNEEGIECRLYTVGDILGIPSADYKEKLKTHLKHIKKAA